jgi:hypothetical protein
MSGPQTSPLLTEAWEAAKSHYYRTSRTIHLAIENKWTYESRKDYLNRYRPVQRYTIEGAYPGVTSAYTVHGLNAPIAELYASNIQWLLNDYYTIVIPGSAFSEASWPYDKTLETGRTIGTILGWLALAFSSPHAKVMIEVPLDVSQLCPLMYGCNLLGMASMKDQMEQILVNIVKFRPLRVLEMEAIWHYHHSTVNPHRDIMPMRLGFQARDFMSKFGQNAREMTSRQWREDPTGKWSEERAAYALFVASHPELLRLMYSPDLHTYVTMLEPRPDRSWSKTRLTLWVEEYRANFGRANSVPMPVIWPQY